jgi:hypothetical protein
MQSCFFCVPIMVRTSLREGEVLQSLLLSLLGLSYLRIPSCVTSACVQNRLRKDQKQKVKEFMEVTGVKYVFSLLHVMASWLKYK